MGKRRLSGQKFLEKMKLSHYNFTLKGLFLSPEVRRNTFISGGYSLYAVAGLGMR